MLRTNKQDGLTLIELLISLAVGVIVSIVGVQLFVTGLSSFTLQKGLGDVNDSGRFGLEFLAKNIQPSGYATYTGTYTPVVTEAGQLPGGTAAMVSGNGTITMGLGANSDQLVVRTWVPSTVEQPRDCEGNLVPNTTNDPGVFAVARYFLRNDPQTNSVALVCDAGFYTEDATTVTGYSGATDDTAGTVLMSFVENFQVLYGITTDATSVTPTRFVTSAEYVALGNPRILAIRVGTLVRSAEKAGNLPNSSTEINLLGQVISAAIQNAANPGVVRRQFVKTIALRNS